MKSRLLGAVCGCVLLPRHKRHGIGWLQACVGEKQMRNRGTAKRYGKNRAGSRGDAGEKRGKRFLNGRRFQG